MEPGDESKIDGHEQDVGNAKETEISEELAEVSKELPMNEATVRLGPNFDRFRFFREGSLFGAVIRLRRQPGALNPGQFCFPVLVSPV